MGEPFIVRAATLGDSEAMRALLAEVDELHRVNAPWIFCTPQAEPRPASFFEQLFSNENAAVLVADSNGEVVGVAIAFMRAPPDFPVFITQTWGVLDIIAVSQSWRRRGVGTALTRRAELWAKGRGAKWFEIGVYDFNETAISFYRSAGYSPATIKLHKPFSDPE